jgi:hypothetical protein
MIGSDSVEVFEYRVLRANSGFTLRASADRLTTAGFHGEIYIDQATHGVRTLTMITDDVPKGFPMHWAAIRIDYDFVAIGVYEHLLPVSAEVVMSHGKDRLERNDLEFSNFRRFGSTSRIVAFAPADNHTVTNAGNAPIP